MFEILPQEIIVYNSNYLDFSSLTSFAKTSKQIYALKDVFFKSYYNREFSFFSSIHPYSETHIKGLIKQQRIFTLLPEKATRITGFKRLHPKLALNFCLDHQFIVTFDKDSFVHVRQAELEKGHSQIIKFDNENTTCFKVKDFVSFWIDQQKDKINIDVIIIDEKNNFQSGFRFSYIDTKCEIKGFSFQNKQLTVLALKTNGFTFTKIEGFQELTVKKGKLISKNNSAKEKPKKKIKNATESIQSSINSPIQTVIWDLKIESHQQIVLQNFSHLVLKEPEKYVLISIENKTSFSLPQDVTPLKIEEDVLIGWDKETIQLINLNDNSISKTVAIKNHPASLDEQSVALQGSYLYVLSKDLNQETRLYEYSITVYNTVTDLSKTYSLDTFNVPYTQQPKWTADWFSFVHEGGEKTNFDGIYNFPYPFSVSKFHLDQEYSKRKSLQPLKQNTKQPKPSRKK